MSKRKCTFKKNDVKRAFQAAEMAGKKISRFEIDNRVGKIILVIDNAATDTAPMNNEWDEVADDEN
ncbi:MAG: hypothetical protein WA322_12725 [Pseudolabrys sp.]